ASRWAATEMVLDWVEAAPWAKIRPPAKSKLIFTLKASSVLLLITAESVTVSPTRKKREAWRRTISGCLVRVVSLAIPNWLASEQARAVAFQPVRESGYFTLTVAWASLSVMMLVCQRM